MALEESLFLGLRLNTGVDLKPLEQRFPEQVGAQKSVIAELVHSGLIERQNSFVRLSQRGRLLSNEVFQRFLAPTVSH